MSYAIKYSIPFLNREQDSCEIQLLQKDYVGDATTLEGSEHPFILRSQAQDNVIPYGIKATESIIEFYSDGLVSLIDFYSEDDTFWQARFYVNASLKWIGFLQLDNCAEQITDITHVIQLNANDGLARLQAKYFLNADGTPIVLSALLSDLILSFMLPSVGIDIDVKAWLNIFENSTQDRNDFNYLTFFPETAIYTSYFVKDDGTTETFYDVLNALLIAFRCMLTQADGFWQIIRWGDVRIFDDGTMPGTLYGNQGGTYVEILFDEALSIGRGITPLPINENQQSRILRPFQFSKETFNYEQPVFITQYNLQIAAGATPFDTNTVGDFRYDDYDIPTYFPAWVQRGGITSYLEIVTNTVTNEEVDRYIVIAGGYPSKGGVQFNPIQVTSGDKFDFNLQWRTDTDTDDTIRYWVRFVLITDDAQTYNLVDTAGAGSNQFNWVGPFAATVWDENLGIYKELTNPNDQDTTQWMSWSLSASEFSTQEIPPIPANGVLLIEVRGTNAGEVGINQTTYFKDITLNFSQLINQSTQIIGQFHDNSQDAAIKNNDQYQASYDDTPRNSIKGTLFTNALTNFDYTDVSTGEDTDIGSLFFTRTALWHRQGVSEERRLGDLNTYNDLFIQRKVRTIVEGDFFGLEGVSLMRLINFTWLSPKKFIFGTWSADYMSCIWNATLYELFETGEVDGDLDNTYLFNYIYNAT